MDYSISFKERSEKGKQILSKQQPVTLQQAKQQVKELKRGSISKKKKQSS